MKVSTDMLLAGVPGQKLAVLVAGIIRCTRHTGIHRSDTVQLIKSGTNKLLRSPFAYPRGKPRGITAQKDKTGELRLRSKPKKALTPW
jgi:hypothetical protein